MSENIRTSRQLTPVLFLHFITNIMAQGITFAGYYRLITNPSWLYVMYIATFGSVGIANFFIQLTVIKWEIIKINYPKCNG